MDSFKSRVSQFISLTRSFPEMQEMQTTCIPLYKKFSTTRTTTNLNTELNSRSSHKNPIIAKKQTLIDNGTPKEHFGFTLWGIGKEDPEMYDTVNVPFMCAD